MGSPAVDQFQGLVSSVAIKAPCHVATTINTSLAGLKIIDGLEIAVGDRVLVRAQTDQKENGVYVVSTGPWVRAADFNDNRDVRAGTQVRVNAGAMMAGAYFIASPDPVVIGTSAIIVSSDVSQASQVAVDAAAVAVQAAADAAASAGANLPVADQIESAFETSFTDDDFIPALDSSTGNLIKRSWGAIVSTLAGMFVSRAGDTMSGALSAGGQSAFDQTNAAFRARRFGNSVEFGYPNADGVQSTLGADQNARSFIAFHGESATAGDGFRTRGVLASILLGDKLGGFKFGTVANVNADTQAFAEKVSIDASGNLRAAAGLYDSTNNRVYSAAYPPPGGSGQPTPTSSTFAKDDSCYAGLQGTGSVADGGTIAGTSLHQFVIVAPDEGSMNPGPYGGLLTGTWKNVSGVTIAGPNPAGNQNVVGRFVRTV